MGIDSEQCWGCEIYAPGFAWKLKGADPTITKFQNRNFCPRGQTASIEMVMGASRDNLIGYLLDDPSVTLW